MYLLCDSAAHVEHINLEFHRSPSSRLLKAAITAEDLSWIIDRHFVPTMHTRQFAFTITFTITLLPAPSVGRFA